MQVTNLRHEGVVVTIVDLRCILQLGDGHGRLLHLLRLLCCIYILRLYIFLEIVLATCEWFDVYDL